MKRERLFTQLHALIASDVPGHPEAGVQEVRTLLEGHDELRRLLAAVEIAAVRRYSEVSGPALAEVEHAIRQRYGVIREATGVPW